MVAVTFEKSYKYISAYVRLKMFDALMKKPLMAGIALALIVVALATTVVSAVLAVGSGNASIMLSDMLLLLAPAVLVGAVGYTVHKQTKLLIGALGKFTISETVFSPQVIMFRDGSRSLSNISLTWEQIDRVVVKKGAVYAFADTGLPIIARLDKITLGDEKSLLGMFRVRQQALSLSRQSGARG